MEMRHTNKQAGFTLIELVVVMVILGIMAAVALPKFVDMGGQARMAKMQGAVGAVQSSVTLVHAAWLAAGSPTDTTPIKVEGGISLVSNAATDIVNGYPAAAAFQRSAQNLAGLDGNFDTGTYASPKLTIKDDKKAACSFTVSNSTAAGTPPVVDVADITLANCG